MATMLTGVLVGALMIVGVVVLARVMRPKDW